MSDRVDHLRTRRAIRLVVASHVPDRASQSHPRGVRQLRTFRWAVAWVSGAVLVFICVLGLETVAGALARLAAFAGIVVYVSTWIKRAVRARTLAESMGDPSERYRGFLREFGRAMVRLWLSVVLAAGAGAVSLLFWSTLGLFVTLVIALDALLNLFDVGFVRRAMPDEPDTPT